MNILRGLAPLINYDVSKVEIRSRLSVLVIFKPPRRLSTVLHCAAFKQQLESIVIHEFVLKLLEYRTLQRRTALSYTYTTLYIATIPESVSTFLPDLEF